MRYGFGSRLHMVKVEGYTLAKTVNRYLLRGLIGFEHRVLVSFLLKILIESHLWA